MRLVVLSVTSTWRTSSSKRLTRLAWVHSSAVSISAHDIRVIRLPRHGASCPIGMGVSCSADRNIKAKINKDGIWLEKMDENPTELIPEELRNPGEGTKGIEIDLDKGIDAVRAELSKYPVSTRVNLKGTIIVARDIAHAKLKARLGCWRGDA